MGNLYSSDQQYMQEMDAFRSLNSDLKRENVSLRKQLYKLKLDHKKMRQQREREQELAHEQSKKPLMINVSRSINKDVIKQYVEEMLENPDINIYGFPDAIEKQIYRNIFTMALNILDKALNSTEVRIFGHKIIFDIQPIPIEEESTTQASAFQASAFQA